MEPCPAWRSAELVPDFFWQIWEHLEAIVQIPFTHKLTFFAKVQYIQSCDLTCGSELRALTSLL